MCTAHSCPRTIVILLFVRLLGAPNLAWAQVSPPDQPFVLRFSGSEFAQAPLNGALDLGPVYTIEAWLYLESAASYAIILGKIHPGSTDPWYDYGFTFDAGGESLGFAASGGTPGSGRRASSGSFPFGRWVHVAGVNDGTNIRLVIDGTTVGTNGSPGGAGNSTTPFSLGNIDWQGNTGFMRQVRVWDRALTDEEIADQAGGTLTGAETGLLAYWPLDDGPGSTARDLGPNELPLQLGLVPGPDERDPSWIDPGFLTPAPPLSPPDQDFVVSFTGHQLLEAPGTELLYFDGPYTYEGWIYLRRSPHSGMILGRAIDPASQDPHWHAALAANPDGTLYAYQSNGSPGSLVSTNSESGPIHDRWTHFAVLSDGTSLSLIVDGNLESSVPLSGHPGTTSVPFSLGAGMQQGSLVQGLHGVLREVRIWNRRLSAAEVRARAVLKLSGAEPGLVAYWPLDDGVGTSARDLGPNSLDLSFSTNPASFPLWVPSDLFSDPFFEVRKFLPPQLLQFPATVSLVDFDSDDDLDVLITQSRITQSLPAIKLPVIGMRNDGDGNFTDATAEVVPPGLNIELTRSITINDFNGDGLTDLYLGNTGFEFDEIVGEHDTLLLQKSDGGFSDVSETHLPSFFAFTHGVTSADVDGDSDIDIFLVNKDEPPADQLLLNDGSGTFSVVYGQLPVHYEADFPNTDYSALFLDADKDADFDLFIGSGRKLAESDPDPLYDDLLLNDGIGNFTVAPEGSVPARWGGPVGSNYTIASDFDGDGWQDLVVSVAPDVYGGKLQLFLSNGDGTFRDESQRIDQDLDPGVGWMIELFPRDLNGDGWMDLVATDTWSGAKLFINQGDAYLKDVTGIVPLGLFGQALGADDLDGDGDIDFFGMENPRNGSGVFEHPDGPIPFVLLNRKPFLPVSPPLLPPVAPVIAGPVNGTLTSLRPELDWDDVPRVGSYWIQIATSASFASTSSDLVHENKLVFESQYIPPRLESDKTYYWRVRSSNVAGDGAWSPVRSFHAENQAPVFATELLPVAEEDSPYVCTIEATDSDQDSVLLTGTDLPAWLDLFDHGDNTATLSGVPPSGVEGTIQIRLTASDGELSIDHLYDLTVVAVNDPPSQPVILSPPQGSRLEIAGHPADRISFSWTESLDEEEQKVQYEWTLSSADDMSVPLMEAQTTSASIDTTISALAAVFDGLGGPSGSEQVVFQQVVASDGHSRTPSDISSLILVRGAITQTDSDGTLPGEYFLHPNAPNPFTNRTTIRFDIPAPGRARLTIHDVLGREIVTILERELSAGTYVTTLDATGLRPGIYFYSLRAGDFTSTRKMVLAR